jgi:hypothetical protein
MPLAPLGRLGTGARAEREGEREHQEEDFGSLILLLLLLSFRVSMWGGERGSVKAMVLVDVCVVCVRVCAFYCSGKTLCCSSLEESLLLFSLFFDSLPFLNKNAQTTEATDHNRDIHETDRHNTHTHTPNTRSISSTQHTAFPRSFALLFFSLVSLELLPSFPLILR